MTLKNKFVLFSLCFSLILLYGCATAPINDENNDTARLPLEYSYDFDDGLTGWLGGFSGVSEDYLYNGNNMNTGFNMFDFGDYNLENGTNRGIALSGYLLDDENNQNDLFTYTTKKFDTTNGLKPNTQYVVDLSFDLVSNTTDNDMINNNNYSPNDRNDINRNNDMIDNNRNYFSDNGNDLNNNNNYVKGNGTDINTDDNNLYGNRNNLNIDNNVLNDNENDNNNLLTDNNKNNNNNYVTRNTNPNDANNYYSIEYDTFQENNNLTRDYSLGSVRWEDLEVDDTKAGYVTDEDLGEYNNVNRNYNVDNNTLLGNLNPDNNEDYDADIGYNNADLEYNNYANNYAYQEYDDIYAGGDMYVKAGVVNVEPAAELIDNENGDGKFYDINLDKGNLSDDGKDMITLGTTLTNVNNNDSQTYSHTFNTSTNENGELWVVIGIDSFRENGNKLYLDNIKVNINEE